MLYHGTNECIAMFPNIIYLDMTNNTLDFVSKHIVGLEFFNMYISSSTKFEQDSKPGEGAYIYLLYGTHYIDITDDLTQIDEIIGSVKDEDEDEKPENSLELEKEVEEELERMNKSKEKRDRALEEARIDLAADLEVQRIADLHAQRMDEE
jgi:hypothetical protein